MSDILHDLNQWREIKHAQALEYAGTPEGKGYMVEAVRYRRAFEEIEHLRQQLLAALAVCEEKDEWLRFLSTVKNIADVEKALAIQPDASALKAHDDALIERCAVVCEQYDEHIEAKRDAKYQAEYAGHLMPPEQLEWAMQQVKASLDKMLNAGGNKPPRRLAI